MTQDLHLHHPAASAADTDPIDPLLPPGGAAQAVALRLARPTVREATRACFASLFEVADLQGLEAGERELVAARVAALQGEAALLGFHSARAAARGIAPDVLAASIAGTPSVPLDARRAAVLGFTDRLTLAPADALPGHLQDLAAVGLSPVAIVVLAQLVAFVNYEVRLLAGLRALASPVSEGDARPAPPPVRHHPSVTFTAAELQWASWLPTVDPATASPEQLAVLDESHSSARTSPYYLTLVHAPEVLRQRSRLFNAVMYGRATLSRAERELSTLGVSLVNGCPYCASVHARLFAQLTKEPEVIEALFRDGLQVPLSPRRRALLDLGVALSANPPAGVGHAVEAARAAGLAPDEILDGIHAAAMFAWANRLMQTLGEPVVPKP